MSRRVIWIGGSHQFKFGLGELRALQDETNSGPGEVLNRLNSGTWRIDDVLSTLTLGLMGAGMDEEEARATVMRVANEDGNDLHLAMTASAALTQRLMGNPDEPKGDQPEKAKGESLADGTSPTSTPSAE